jgi:hypothetical protein
LPCKAGQQACNKDGNGWGDCSGEVLPKPADDCSISDDDSNCNGTHDCPCKPDDKPVACYDGAPNTEGVGTCKAGTKKCKSDGTGFDVCLGQIQPQVGDDCVNLQDTNCDNKTDCMCTAGSMIICYDGPLNTQHVGTCKDGTKTCLADGTGYGPCANEVKPNPVDTCGDNLDDNCDGTPDDLCVCNPNTTASCYDGKPGTSGKGICHDGTKTCNATGTAWSACMNEQVPQVEDCAKKGDEDCDGVGCSDVVWSEQFVGGQAGATDYGEAALAIDSAGNIYGTVVEDGAYVLNNGVSSNYVGPSFEVFVYKTDPTGKALWTTRLPTPITALAVDNAGNTYVAGVFSGSVVVAGATLNSAGANDGIIVKLNSSGTPVAAVRFGGTGNEDLYSLAVSPDGLALVVGGGYQGACAFPGLVALPSASGVDAYVATYTTSGLVAQWAKTVGDKSGSPAGTQAVTSIAVDSGENVVVLGGFTNSFSSAAVTGIDAGGGDLFLGRFSKTGTQQWMKPIASVNSDGSIGVVTDPVGDIVFLVSTGPINLGGGNLPAGGILAKYDHNGAYVWSSSVSVTTGSNLAVDGQGNTFVASDLSLSKYVAGGAQLWTKTFVSQFPGWYTFPRVAVDINTGQSVFSISAAGPSDFGGGVLDPTPAQGVMLTKFQP